MSLIRIKHIKNIGVFSDFFREAARFEFGKVNFIYGCNAHGKSTLTDIFKSLSKNDPSILEKRKTIPNRGDQEVSLSFLRSEKGELPVLFENGSWNFTGGFSDVIAVFDTEFIHKNIFTGLTIDRSNKEHLFQFILGESGTKVAKEIKNKKEELGRRKKEQGDKIPNYVKGKSQAEIDEFVNYPIGGLNKEDIEELILKNKNDLQMANERLVNPQKILSLPEPKEYNAPRNTIISALTTLNEAFQKDYVKINEDALRKVNNHIHNNFTNDEAAAQLWIKKGLDYCSQDNCPFCGQKLLKADDLIASYKAYFDDAYKEHAANIRRICDKSRKEFDSWSFREKEKLLSIVNVIIENYKEVILDKSFHNDLEDLNNLISSLREDKLRLMKSELLTSIDANIARKNQNPYERVGVISLDEFNSALNIYLNEVTKAESIIKRLLQAISACKQQHGDLSKIQKTVIDLEEDAKNLEYKHARITQDQACVSYVQHIEAIGSMDEQIKLLTKTLAEDQNKYLKKYFDEVNSIFGKLGGRDFHLETTMENKGHAPVLALKVTYKSEKIDNNTLNSVFSDSDRRALAFSIFWAQLILSGKESTMVVLDDPIVSFDDNRITKTINLLAEDFRKNNRQYVIMTHYPHLIQRYYDIVKKHDTKYFLIEKNKYTSYLKDVDREQFGFGDYQKSFLRIYRYINMEHNEDIKKELRVFVESMYLPMMFAEQFEKHNLYDRSLSVIVATLFVQYPKVKQRLDEFMCKPSDLI